MKKRTESAWAAKYRDPRWQKMRLQIMERDKWTCRSCGKAEGVTLNVHHAYYESGRDPWEYPKQTLVTWCEECHKERHLLSKHIAEYALRLDETEYRGLVHALLDYGTIFDLFATYAMPSAEHVRTLIETVALSYTDGIDQGEDQASVRAEEAMRVAKGALT